MRINSVGNVYQENNTNKQNRKIINQKCNKFTGTRTLSTKMEKNRVEKQAQLFYCTKYIIHTWKN